MDVFKGLGTGGCYCEVAAYHVFPTAGQGAALNVAARIECGHLKVGDIIVVLPAGEEAVVKCKPAEGGRERVCVCLCSVLCGVAWLFSVCVCVCVCAVCCVVLHGCLVCVCVCLHGVYVLQCIHENFPIAYDQL